MNKLITFIIASFVLAASAFADVGESPAVSLAEWRKLGVIPQGWETVEGQPCLSGQTSDGNMAIHVFTVDRKYNIACILVVVSDSGYDRASQAECSNEHLEQVTTMTPTVACGDPLSKGMDINTSALSWRVIAG